MRMLLVALLSVFVAAGAGAVEPDEMLDDPALEARAQALDRQLRCVVCRSQSIAESDAPLARDMRLVMRERIAAGDSDEAAVGYLVERYGDYVRLRPPLTGTTALLWFFPLLLLALGAAGAFAYVARMRRVADEDEDATEADETA